MHARIKYTKSFNNKKKKKKKKDRKKENKYTKLKLNLFIESIRSSAFLSKSNRQQISLAFSRFCFHGGLREKSV